MTLTLSLSLAAIAIFFVILMARPRLLLLPIHVIGAVWAGFRPLFGLPIQLRDYLSSATVAKRLDALHSMTDVAVKLYATGSDFRPAAREILGKVMVDFGIRPNFEEPARPKSFSEGRVAQVANIVNDGNAVKREKAATAGDEGA